eukprot:TRINITY_DN2683_c0_g1_i5.p1 TRINITY_DN2683_c0_g1~~TRINITY_DN2683_c0_g1_i5.p1  ORF type:complete len:280 (-),score=65.91 TRINITY_DN2683_c0_g1_i5:169-1008(-)
MRSPFVGGRVRVTVRVRCVLGNHELNLLRGDHKHGNSWFYGEPEVIRKDKFAVSFQMLADEGCREEVLEFCRAMPLVLEREDMVVVHACWHEGSADALRDLEQQDVTEVFDLFARQIASRIEAGGVVDADTIDQMEQNENPVKVLTSGMEVPAPEPFFAGGKMRTLERERWWESYDGADKKLVVFGHYWRRFMGEVAEEVSELHPEGFHPTGPDMFPGNAPNQLLGGSKKAMCVDFAAGVRYEERGMSLKEGSLGTHLAALRLPEMDVHLEDGRVLPAI